MSAFSMDGDDVGKDKGVKGIKSRKGSISRKGSKDRKGSNDGRESGDSKGSKESKEKSENDDGIDDEENDNNDNNDGQEEEEEETPEIAFKPFLGRCLRMALECPYSARMTPLARSQGIIWVKLHAQEAAIATPILAEEFGRTFICFAFEPHTCSLPLHSSFTLTHPHLHNFSLAISQSSSPTPHSPRSVLHPHPLISLHPPSHPTPPHTHTLSPPALEYPENTAEWALKVTDAYYASDRSYLGGDDSSE